MSINSPQAQKLLGEIQDLLDLLESCLTKGRPIFVDKAYQEKHLRWADDDFALRCRTADREGNWSDESVYQLKDLESKRIRSLCLRIQITEAEHERLMEHLEERVPLDHSTPFLKPGHAVYPPIPLTDGAYDSSKLFIVYVSSNGYDVICLTDLDGMVCRKISTVRITTRDHNMLKQGQTHTWVRCAKEGLVK